MSYEHLVAGLVGGVTSTLVLHPLDLLKVRFAVADGQSNLKKTYKNIPNAFATIMKDEGFRGFYKGVTPNCLGAGSAWGLYFLFYNSVKENMLKNDPQKHLGIVKNMFAGACAGVLTTTITNPIWVVKTRLCLQYGDVATPEAITSKASPKNPKLKLANEATSNRLPLSKQYSGTWDAFKKVYKYEGVTGLYRGFLPGLLNISHGSIQLAAYEEMKRFYLIRNNLPSDHKLTTAHYLTCAAASKLLAATMTFPFQVLRARLQDQYVNYDGIVDVVKRTWRNEGFFGFYKGLRPSLYRVVPASCITFLVYEQLMAEFEQHGSKLSSIKK